jgi:Permuted papain-like amidase enzyme, YaeF/YiiX, C92 family
MTRIDTFLDWTASRLTSHIICAADPAKTPTHSDIAQLRETLIPGDVLLVDGCDRVSSAIRYFTQSSWSHAALYVGDLKGSPVNASGPQCPGDLHCIVEMNLGKGCVSAPLEKYQHYPTRICRPANLTAADRDAVVQFMIDRIGLSYDTRNVVDLARYLCPAIPIPRRFRRRMLSLGSGDSTRAICSTLIAQAFESVGYPILPRIERAGPLAGLDGYTAEEIFHIRHHSLFAPRDFDISPYFEVVKPTLNGFHYKSVKWAARVP